MPLSMPRSQKQSDILSPRIDIAPDNALVDQVIRIRLSGIMPNHAVTLRAQMQDNLGGAWTSHASFRANATGAVDVSSQPPLSGTYQGTDQMGLFWSMATQDELKGATFVLETPNAPTITTPECGGWQPDRRVGDARTNPPCARGPGRPGSR